MIGDNYRHPCVSCNTEIGSHDSPSTYHCMECFMRAKAVEGEPQERHYETHQRAQDSAFNTQVGGNHYTKLAIQPMEYSFKNKLDPCQHTIIKYVTRFRDKGGKEDLEKAIDCIQMLIEMEYGE